MLIQPVPQPPPSLQDVDKLPPGWEGYNLKLNPYMTATPPTGGALEVRGGQLIVGDYLQACMNPESNKPTAWGVYVGACPEGLGHSTSERKGARFIHDYRLVDPTYRFLVRRRGPKFNEWGEDSL